MSKIIGIDLGTSTSEAAFINEFNRPEIILNKQGNAITPSVVYIDENKNPVVGARAKEMVALEPENTIIEVKRLMGSEMKVKARGEEYSPQKISSYILSYLKECAEDYLGEPVSRAVITVPAYFTDAQRKATVEAGQLAGLTVERIINEPTAASLDYGILHMDECKNAIIYDLGGGTLDVTVLELFEGVIDVKATCGNNKLGGLDFDNAIVNHLVNRCKSNHKADPYTDKRALMRVKNAAEACKISLSENEAFEIELPFLMEKNGQPVGIKETVKRVDFEALIKDLVESTTEQLGMALKDAGLVPSDIDLILLVGGSTKIPLVASFIERELGISPKTLVDPDLAVVRGAAIQAGIIDGMFGEKGIVLTDVCPYTLSIETLVDTFFGETICKPLILRNTTIPVHREDVFKTSHDKQTQAKIAVYEGESSDPHKNMLLGEFLLGGIPPRKAGKEKIVVEFSYDLNGILVSRAKAVSTDSQAEITIDMNAIDHIDAKNEEEIDLSDWENAKLAKKYRAVINKAERILKTHYNEDLSEGTFMLKKALVTGADKYMCDFIKQEILDTIYTLENDSE